MKKFFYLLVPSSFLFSAGCATAGNAFDGSSFQNTSLDYEDTQTQIQTKISALPSKPSVQEISLDDALNQVEQKSPNNEIALEQNKQEVSPAPVPETPTGVQDEKIELQPQPSILPPPSTVDQDSKVAPAAPPLNSPVQAPTVAADSRYLIAPHALQPGQVNTFSTQIPINETGTNHLSNYDVLLGVRLGNSRDTTLGFNGTKLFSPYIEESASKDRVYRTEYTNTYVQARTVRQHRNFSSVLGPDQATVREDQVFVPSVGVGRVRQVLVSNGEQSGIGRTVRGLNYSFSDRNALLNTGIQVLTEVLPNAEPSLSAGKPDKQFTINSNLMLAANNLRLPSDSLTAYSAGWGYALNTSDLKEISPPANYNSFWVGLSPMIERAATASPENASPAIFRLRETTDYYPHVSFTGNTTTVDSVFRYYTGAIFNTGLTPLDVPNKNIKSKAYGGLDFSTASNSGFSYDASLIGFTDSDIDNYSRASANLSQRINLGGNSALVIGAGANYAFDGTSIIDNQVFKPGSSYIKTSAALNFGNITFGTAYFIPNSFPDSIKSLLSTSVAWRVQDNLAVSAYYTPVNENQSRSPYGANASFRIGADANSPSLIVDWKNVENSVGPRAATDNVFGVFLRFGDSFTPPKVAP